MVFTSPSYIPQLPFEPPDSVPIPDFLFGKEREAYGRYPIEKSKAPFTCGLTGKSYSATEVAERYELLAAALSKELGWQPDEGTELDKVIAIFSVNTIDTLTACWAAHRLNGAANNISATYTPFELSRQLKVVKAKAIFTSLPLLQTALKCADECDIPRKHVFLLDVPQVIVEGEPKADGVLTVDDLIEKGRELPKPKPLEWTKGQGARQTAFLCCSSGTSGAPKSVRISHQNVIANVMQITASDSTFKSKEPETSLGVLPMSHNLSLMAISHGGVYRGDGVVVMPRFNLEEILHAIDEHKLGRLWLVPQIVLAMLNSPELVKKYDLSSVNTTVVGASVLSQDIESQFSDLLSGCNLLQGYGLTETTVAVTLTNPGDYMLGSCGHLFPGCEARLLSTSGEEVTEHDKAGRLYVRGPTMMIGYLNNPDADAEMLKEDGWLDTGDLCEFRKSEAGHSHLFIIDRVKELIKVRSLQVSPTELENHLLNHPAVKESAVVPLPDQAAGELPMAFVVKSPAFQDTPDDECSKQINEHVNSALSDHKHLVGGIVYVKELPKSAGGKTQRGEVKQWANSMSQERKEKEKEAAKVQVYVFDDDSDSDEDDDE